MNNAISVKALQESKVISDAMQDAGLMGEDNAPKFAAAIAYGFRVKLTEPGVWVSIKKGYKEDDYGARIYILNRAVDGGAVLGESYYMNSAGFESAQSAVEAVSEALKTFDYSFFDGVEMFDGAYQDLNESEEDESEALEIEAGQQ